MPSNDSRESTSTKSSGIDNTHQNSEHLKCVPGWQMPETGVYGLAFWAHMWQVEPRTVVEWIKKYKMKFIGPSVSNCYVSAKEFLSCIGRITDDQT